MSPRVRTAVWVLALGLLAGCASAPPPVNNVDTKALNAYLKYAGPPIGNFRYLGRYYGFRALGGRYVVLWTTVNDAYLITVYPPCFRLAYAYKLGLTSADHLVSTNIDWVTFNDKEGRCRIQQMQPIDYKAMKSGGGAPP